MFTFHEEEIALPQLLATLRALRITQNVKDDPLARIRSCFAVPSCLGSPPASTFAHPPNSGEGPTSAAIVNVGRFPGPARGLFLRCPAGVACGILPTPFAARGFGPLKRFRIGSTPISRHAH